MTQHLRSEKPNAPCSAVPVGRSSGWLALLLLIAALSSGSFVLESDQLHIPACSEPFDAAIYPWNFQFLAHSLDDGELLRTRKLYHPTGESLALYTPTYVYALLAQSFRWLDAEPSWVHRATAWLLFTSTLATALLAFALGRSLGLPPVGAFGAALLFTLCAGRLMNVARLNLFCTEFLLLLFLLSWRAWCSQRLLTWVAAGASGALLLWQSQPLFFQGSLALSLFLASRLVVRAGRSQLRQKAKGLALSFATFLLLASPFLVAMLRAIPESRALGQTASIITNPHANLDATALFLPSRHDRGYGDLLGIRSPSMFEGQADGASVSSFLGFAWWALILLALCCTPSRRWRGPLLFAVATAALAMGPVFYFLGIALPLPTPYQALRWLPLVGLSKSPIRLLLLVQLGLAVLAGLGVQRLWPAALRTARERLAAAATLGLLSLALFEQSETLPLQSVGPFKVPPAIAALARDPRPGAILDFPYDGLPLPAHRVTATAMALAAHHQRPIFFGLFPRASRTNLEIWKNTQLRQDLEALGSGQQPVPDAQVLRDLEALDVRAVQVHEFADSPPPVQESVRVAQAYFGALLGAPQSLPIGPGYQVHLYLLP
jgi:hypothetical protein